jgi:hypothetical protein
MTDMSIYQANNSIKVKTIAKGVKYQYQYNVIMTSLFIASSFTRLHALHHTTHYSSLTINTAVQPPYSTLAATHDLLIACSLPAALCVCLLLCTAACSGAGSGPCGCARVVGGQGARPYKPHRASEEVQCLATATSNVSTR